MGAKMAAILAAGSMFFFSCERKDKDDPAGPIGGKGGNATLKVAAAHHATSIDSCRIYIKYNATDAPQQYDDSADCVMQGGQAIATFTELKQGNYYLFGRGWDPNILQVVQGGVPYTITADSVFQITIAVTEPH